MLRPYRYRYSMTDLVLDPSNQITWSDRPSSVLRHPSSSLVSLVTKLLLGNALQKLQLLLGLQEAGASSDGSQSGAWEPENRLF
ncbi:MAG: hypothetical protein HC899_37155 [Leptolyngbyaceae cyanobacterium SM1_4_3]|nr:hypothetical protein [Leptolyngbyaceae cyanobacterium SM1_4_3]